MNSQQDVIYGLMNELEEALDKGLPLLGSVSIVKKDNVTNILDKLYAALPDEINFNMKLNNVRKKLFLTLKQKLTDFLANLIC